MKKLFTLTISVICITTIANAQIKKGSVTAGGEISYANYNVYLTGSQENQKNNNAVFSISVGKAVKENSVIGLNATYNHGSNKYFNGIATLTYKSDSYSAGAFWREYKKLARDLYFFTELNGSYFHNNQKTIDSAGNSTFSSDGSGGALAVTPGISYKIYRKLHLELLIPNIASIQYSVTKNSTGNKQEQFAFTTRLNSNPLNNLGVGLG